MQTNSEVQLAKQPLCPEKEGPCDGRSYLLLAVPDGAVSILLMCSLRQVATREVAVLVVVSKCLDIFEISNFNMIYLCQGMLFDFRDYL